ncbi:MAG: hypothetical protein AB1757_30230 [Acidobacteriota bacterium]
MIINNVNTLSSEEPLVAVVTEIPNDAAKLKVAKKTKNLALNQLREPLPRQRETGDQVNGFMLCALVSQSSKRLKERAERVGVSLPMSMITRSILNAYLLVAKDHDGPFADAKPDFQMLKMVDEKVLQEVLARYAKERTKPAQASRVADERRM